MIEKFLYKLFCMKNFSSAWRVLTSFPYCWWCIKLEINFLISIRCYQSRIEFSFFHLNMRKKRNKFKSICGVETTWEQIIKKKVLCTLLLAMKIVSQIFLEKIPLLSPTYANRNSQKWKRKLFSNSIKCNWTRSIREECVYIHTHKLNNRGSTKMSLDLRRLKKEELNCNYFTLYNSSPFFITVHALEKLIVSKVTTPHHDEFPWYLCFKGGAERNKCLQVVKGTFDCFSTT